jgi:hypothetical protein
MKENQYAFLRLLELPPLRLPVEQTAWILNCASHDIPILVGVRLLKPLGKPAQNAVKYFRTADVLELPRDPAWLSKMTIAISQHWHKKNARRKNSPQDDSGGESSRTIQSNKLNSRATAERG